MTKFRIVKNPGSDSGPYFVGCDTHSLFVMHPSELGATVVVGDGIYTGREGEHILKTELNKGRGIRNLPRGTTIQLEV